MRHLQISLELNFRKQYCPLSPGNVIFYLNLNLHFNMKIKIYKTFLNILTDKIETAYNEADRRGNIFLYTRTQ